MRSNRNALFVFMALPTVVMGALLAGFIAASASGGELLASVGPAEPEQGTVKLALLPDEEELVEENEEPGYGYVEGVPDDAPVTLDPAEKEVAMEAAAVTARLGAGWGEGEMLAEDLRLLESIARGQLEMYAEEMRRLRDDDEGPAEGLQAMESRYAAAEEGLEAFESAGESLRRSMVELQEIFERTAGGGETRR